MEQCTVASASEEAPVWLRLRLLDASAQVACHNRRQREALLQLYGGACSLDRPAWERENDGHIWVLHSNEGSQVLGHALLISSLLTAVRSHWLFHAAALSGPSGGLLLVGPSGAGKTTLALALAQRGYRWFSDEVAAVDRRTGQLTPFPRAALVRRGVLHLLPDLACRISRWPWQQDEVAGCWEPSIYASPTPPRAVFILPPFEPQGATQVAVSRMTVALGALLSSDLNLAGAQVDDHGYCVVLSWPYPLAARTLANWAGMCRREGVLLLNARSQASPCDFSQPPRVDPCPPTLAWWQLGRACWNRPDPVASEPTHSKGALSAFMWMLAGLLQDVNCYLLSPGPLQDTLGLIDQTLTSLQSR